MAEENMEEKVEVVKKPYSKEKIGVTIILVGLTAAIFLAIGYWAGTQSVPVENEATTTATVTTTATTTSPTTDETASWKTYTNDTYGFSFRYPADKYEILSNSYNVTDSSKASDFYLRVIGGTSNDATLAEFTTIYPGRYNDTDMYALDLKNFAESYWQLNDTKEGTSVSDLKNKQINNKTMYYFDVSGSFTTPWGGGLLTEQKTAIFACKTDGEVLSTTDPKLIVVYDKDSVFDQILSTFQFTK